MTDYKSEIHKLVSGRDAPLITTLLYGEVRRRSDPLRMAIAEVRPDILAEMRLEAAGELLREVHEWVEANDRK